MTSEEMEKSIEFILQMQAKFESNLARSEANIDKLGTSVSNLRVSVAELAAVAGLRWTIEECFQSAKGETGLDHCEARSWHGWHRHMTLSMLALAFLAGLRARLKEAQIDASSGKANKRSLSAAA